MGSCNHKTTHFQVNLPSPICLLLFFLNPTKATNIYNDYNEEDETGSRYKQAIIPIVGYFVIMAAFLICNCLRKRVIRQRNTSAGNEGAQTAADHEYSVTVEAARKLDARIIESFPVVVFPPPSDSKFRFTECHICLEEWAEGERVVMLPACGHGYHKECVLRWMTTRDSRCPDCRHDYGLL